MIDKLADKSWQSALKNLCHPRVVTLLFLGLSAGIPFSLIFSSLSVWLREAGVERATVTYFSWAALGYSFKFVWAPLVDQLPIPILTKWLGRRRSWMLLGQLAIILSIVLMSSVDPQLNTNSLTLMAIAAVMLGFSAATQDLAIDAYRIESAETDLQALMSATYIAGFRIAMLVSGAGSLFIADWLGSAKGAYAYQAWQSTYLLMAMIMLVGVLTTLIIKEPERPSASTLVKGADDYLRILLFFVLVVGAFVASLYFGPSLPDVISLLLAIAVASIIALGLVKMKIVEYRVFDLSYVAPVQDFFQRYGLSLACLLLALVGLYRISDIVLGVISNVFYYDLGFSKSEIAGVIKVFGMLMTLAGAFIGGVLAIRFGVIKILFLGALLSAATNLLFMVLASKGHDMTWLYIVISADNLSAGIATAAFVAFLSSLTNISFTATQYAIFSSLMTLFPKILGGYSGTMVDSIGYPSFFLATALMGIPVLVLIIYIGRRQQFSFRLRDTGKDEPK